MFVSHGQGLNRRQGGIVSLPEDFDKHLDHINVRNGIVDLRAGTLVPHGPAMRMTRIDGADPRESASLLLC
jgi:phage/plasmid-associated DNA primase